MISKYLYQSIICLYRLVLTHNKSRIEPVRLFHVIYNYYQYGLINTKYHSIASTGHLQLKFKHISVNTPKNLIACKILP